MILPCPIAVTSIGTHVPGPPVDTKTLLDHLDLNMSVDLSASLADLGIESRHSIVLDYPSYLSGRSHRKITTTTAEMMACAAESCFSNTDEDILPTGTVIAITTTPDQPIPCAGYGLVSLLPSRLRQDTNIINMQGQGCSAVLKAVDLAYALVSRDPHRSVLIVAAESSTGYVPPLTRGCYHSFREARSMPARGDAELIKTQNALAAFLFGDGAVALLVQTSKSGGMKLGNFNHLSNLAKTDADLLRMDEGGVVQPSFVGFPTYFMSPLVPRRALAYSRELLGKLLTDTGSGSVRQLSHHFAAMYIHTGSIKILKTVCRDIGLHADDARVALAFETLKNYGNLASCSIGFMMAASMQKRLEGAIALLAFGAGFSASSCSGRVH